MRFRPRAHEPPIPDHRGFLEKLLRPVPIAKGVRSCGVVNFQSQPVRPAPENAQDPQADGALSADNLRGQVGADLRVVFFVDGDTVWAVDVGTHASYKG